MAKLDPEEKAKLLGFLAELKDEQTAELWANEIRERVHLRVTEDKCHLPIGQDACPDTHCTDCVFNQDRVPQVRGVSGSSAGAFEENDLTVRPKGWDYYPHYTKGGSLHEDYVIRRSGWCPKCKEKLIECSCNSHNSFKEE